MKKKRRMSMKGLKKNMRRMSHGQLPIPKKKKGGDEELAAAGCDSSGTDTRGGCAVFVCLKLSCNALCVVVKLGM